jgi:hypothetical protein
MALVRQLDAGLAALPLRQLRRLPDHHNALYGQTL